jgi:hypothetical protein
MKRHTILNALTALSCAVMVSGCGSIIPPSQGGSPAASGSYSGSQSSSPRPASRMTSIPQSLAPRSEDASCLAQLDSAGARFSAIPDTYTAPGCNQLGTVQLAALSGDNSKFAVSNIGPVQCRTASAFNGWARYGVDRAARQILGSPLARIETMGSYSCRNIAGSNKRSAHATAGAIDVSAFVLQDGRRISLSADWNGGTLAEREFLRVVHKSACKRFGTVLGPNYNAAHADHFHLEGTGANICR